MKRYYNKSDIIFEKDAVAAVCRIGQLGYFFNSIAELDERSLDSLSPCTLININFNINGSNTFTAGTGLPYSYFLPDGCVTTEDEPRPFVGMGEIYDNYKMKLGKIYKFKSLWYEWQAVFSAVYYRPNWTEYTINIGKEFSLSRLCEDRVYVLIDGQMKPLFVKHSGRKVSESV